MKTILVSVMSRVGRDDRVLRHIEALRGSFRIVTLGFGDAPEGVDEHLRIPDRASSLPLNPSAFIPHWAGAFTRSSRNTAAIRFGSKAIENLRFDVALLNDAQTLPLMDVIYKPVVVDMHEYAPREMEEDWRFRVFLQNYYDWLCRTHLPRATKVISVSRPLAAEYRRNFSVAVDVVLNARRYCEINLRPYIGPQLRLVHTGLAAAGRRLDVSIDAVARLPHVSLDLYLVPAPRQASTFRSLRRRAEKLSNVRILEPVPSARLPALINEYDMSLVFRPATSFNNVGSMPNKLFDSIQARVGVLCGPSSELERFCTEHQIGVASAEFSRDSLVTLLSTLTPDQVNGFKSASDKLARSINAESEGRKLLELVSSALYSR